MTYDQIKEILVQYDERLGSLAYCPVRCNGEFQTSFGTCLDHVRWMCQHLLELLKDSAIMDEQKLHRWLGFIQGVLYIGGIYTINEMRQHNRKRGTEEWIAHHENLP